MTNKIIYHTPGSCSRVVLVALERIGAPFEPRTVSLMTGAQYQPGFQAINPKGKVPVLVEGDLVVTEIPVILYHLADRHPEAALLPIGPDGRPSLTALSDLIWVASVLHPLGARLMRPGAVSPGDPDGAKAVALEQMAAHAIAVDRRLGQGAWWYGGDWSIVDTFVAWAFGLAAAMGFDVSHYPNIAAHRRAAESLPAFTATRALEIDIAEREGLTAPPGISL